MAMYDRKCRDCGAERIDVLEPMVPLAPVECQKCGGVTERVWLTKAATVIGDEVDVWIENGLCHPGGRPRHFRSKAEIARAAKEAGLTNVVRHLGTKGGDKSKHTTRWI